MREPFSLSAGPLCEATFLYFKYKKEHAGAAQRCILICLRHRQLWILCPKIIPSRGSGNKIFTDKQRKTWIYAT